VARKEASDWIAPPAGIGEGQDRVGSHADQHGKLAWIMLPIIVQHLPRDRERMRLREVQMAGRLGLTLNEYRSLEVGELPISNDLYERIVEMCGWPKG
jgi:hypothetical protein